VERPTVTSFPSSDGTPAEIEQAWIDSMEAWNEDGGSVVFSCAYAGTTTEDAVIGTIGSGLTADWQASVGPPGVTTFFPGHFGPVDRARVERTFGEE
jgi:hypothetical protein